VHPDHDDYDSPIGTRGGYVRVDLECSGGHSYALIVASHKGAEFLGLVSVKGTPIDRRGIRALVMGPRGSSRGMGPVSGWAGPAASVSARRGSCPP
jgi:hypothetical protein